MSMRMQLNWNLNGGLWAQNVLHVMNTSGPDQSMADDYAEDLGDLLTANTNLRAGLFSGVTLESVSLQHIVTPNNPVFTSLIQVAGTGGTQALPLQTQYVVTLQTGPSFTNGRYYQFGASETANTANGRPTAAFGTGVRTFVEGMRLMPGVIESGAQLAVFHRSMEVFSPVIGVRRSDSSAIQGWQVQRRRRDGIITPT